MTLDLIPTDAERAGKGHKARVAYLGAARGMPSARGWRSGGQVRGGSSGRWARTTNRTPAASLTRRCMMCASGGGRKRASRTSPRMT